MGLVIKNIIPVTMQEQSGKIRTGLSAGSLFPASYKGFSQRKKKTPSENIVLRRRRNQNLRGTTSLIT